MESDREDTTPLVDPNHHIDVPRKWKAIAFAMTALGGMAYSYTFETLIQMTYVYEIKFGDILATTCIPLITTTTQLLTTLTIIITTSCLQKYSVYIMSQLGWFAGLIENVFLCVGALVVTIVGEGLGQFNVLMLSIITTCSVIHGIASGTQYVSLVHLSKLFSDRHLVAYLVGQSCSGLLSHCIYKLCTSLKLGMNWGIAIRSTIAVVMEIVACSIGITMNCCSTSISKIVHKESSNKIVTCDGNERRWGKQFCLTSVLNEMKEVVTDRWDTVSGIACLFFCNGLLYPMMFNYYPLTNIEKTGYSTLFSERMDWTCMIYQLCMCIGSLMALIPLVGSRRTAIGCSVFSFLCITPVIVTTSQLSLYFMTVHGQNTSWESLEDVLNILMWLSSAYSGLIQGYASTRLVSGVMSNIDERLGSHVNSFFVFFTSFIGSVLQLVITSIVNIPKVTATT